MLGAVVPIEPLHHRRDRDRGDRRAGRGVPLDDASGWRRARRPRTRSRACCAASRRRRLALANSMIAALIAGIVGIIAAAITELDTSTLPLQIVPALAAAVLAGLSSLVARRRRRASGSACCTALRHLRVGAVVVPDLGRDRDPRRHRPARVPARRAGDVRARGALPGPRPADRARPAGGAQAEATWSRSRRRSRLVAAVALVVLPYDFRQARVNSISGS